MDKTTLSLAVAGRLAWHFAAVREDSYPHAGCQSCTKALYSLHQRPVAQAPLQPVRYRHSNRAGLHVVASRIKCICLHGHARLMQSRPYWHSAVSWYAPVPCRVLVNDVAQRAPTSTVAIYSSGTEHQTGILTGRIKHSLRGHPQRRCRQVRT